MDKTKRTWLRVRKNKAKPTKQNAKKFLNNVLDYLKSDSYMFAPLISPPLSAGGAKMKEPIRGNKKRVLKKVGKYMESDAYMYAPLVSSEPVESLPSGQFLGKSKVTVEVSTTTMLNLKENRKSIESANAITENQPRSDSCPGKSNISGNQTFGRGEMVKHMVYQHCRSTSVSGKAMPDLQLRKLFVE